jgi:hypothetical protein
LYVQRTTGETTTTLVAVGSRFLLPYG